MARIEDEAIIGVLNKMRELELILQMKEYDFNARRHKEGGVDNYWRNHYDDVIESRKDLFNEVQRMQQIGHTPEPKTSTIANNIGVVYDRVSLLSKVSLKHSYALKEENRILRYEIFVLQKVVGNLEKEVLRQKPLTKTEVRELVREIAQQPKLVEKEALKLTEELKKSVRKVEYLLKEVKTVIGG
ncbi:hypothetical protein ZIOFF_056753 [Zingiber officinale]|uniref:Uncharacterized protein n=1 Tax=Zingiber officinale TaxID=94328 RepID=A0A8J5FIC0_ZINOF|nr:hypothetical protein ZIOFF_056753 [Zingiber officinale]